MHQLPLGWGQDNPAFRMFFAARFLPEGTTEQMRWFSELLPQHIDLLAQGRSGVLADAFGPQVGRQLITADAPLPARRNECEHRKRLVQVGGFRDRDPASLDDDAAEHAQAKQSTASQTETTLA